MSTTCIAAVAEADGATSTLIVREDGENFSSTIQRVTDLDAADELLYKVPTWLTALWLSPGGHLYAVAASGHVHTNRSGKWTALDLHCREGLTWIWGLDDERVFACGRKGHVVALRGGRAEPMSEGVEGHLYGLQGTREDYLYAVGERNGIFHYDGKSWTKMASPAPAKDIVNAVFCASPDKAYAATEGGMLLECADGKWSAVGKLDSSLHALTMFQGKLYVGAGNDGLYAYEGGKIGLVKDNIYSYGLSATERHLTAAGNAEAARYDGEKWDAVEYT